MLPQLRPFRFAKDSAAAMFPTVFPFLFYHFIKLLRISVQAGSGKFSAGIYDVPGKLILSVIIGIAKKTSGWYF